MAVLIESNGFHMINFLLRLTRIVRFDLPIFVKVLPPALILSACSQPLDPSLTPEQVKRICAERPKYCDKDGRYIGLKGDPERRAQLQAARKKQEEERKKKVEVSRRKNAVIKASAKPIAIKGDDFLVASTDDQKFAYIYAVRPRQSATMETIEAAVESATGCEAIMPAGALASAPSINRQSNFGLREEFGLKLETYCAGDNRPRAVGLKDSPVLRKDGEVVFSDYPQIGQTYLTFSRPHGFQITYFADASTSWLWYPGNRVALPAKWRSTRAEVCFTYGKNTFNPVLGQSGGKEVCRPVAQSQRTLVAKLPGDKYNLATASVPYERGKCDAPLEFSFDRDRFKCN